MLLILLYFLLLSMNDIDMIMGDIKYILKVDNHKEYYLQIIQEVFENLNYFNYQNHFFYIKKNDLINLFKKRLIKKYQNIKNQIISQKFNLSKIYTTINDVVYYIFKCNIQKKIIVNEIFLEKQLNFLKNMPSKLYIDGIFLVEKIDLKWAEI